MIIEMKYMEEYFPKRTHFKLKHSMFMFVGQFCLFPCLLYYDFKKLIVPQKIVKNEMNVKGPPCNQRDLFTTAAKHLGMRSRMF